MRAVPAKTMTSVRISGYTEYAFAIHVFVAGMFVDRCN